MKSETFSCGFDPEEIAAALAAAPDHIDDPECPYDPNDPAQIHEFFGNGMVVDGGGLPGLREAWAARRRGERGPGRNPPKTAINIRLSSEVLEAFKATGKGWQSRIDGALKDWLKGHSPA
jgi:BrnA antitoxin of type II toxin-antitoxin system